MLNVNMEMMQMGENRSFQTANCRLQHSIHGFQHPIDKYLTMQYNMLQPTKVMKSGTSFSPAPPAAPA